MSLSDHDNSLSDRHGDWSCGWLLRLPFFLINDVLLIDRWIL